jgi:N-acetyl sugar amidotransferase
MPETQEGLKFDELGICQACQSSEQKIHINWVEREKALRMLLENAKAKAGNNYDCIVPISGGKDSVYQLHILVKVYGMKPLAVTFSHNWYSETGWYNLQNALQEFNVDHIMFTPNRDLVNRIANRSLGAIGDACWHCHSGVGAFPLQAAVRFNIPLLIWGESIAESSGRASYIDPTHKFDREYFIKVSAKRQPREMVCDTLSERDLYPFNVPTIEEIERVGVYGIHLGDYIFWDEERQTEFIRQEYGWKETEMEGAYKGYKSAECIMAGVHDFTCYLKRGYGRSTFQACVDVRNGLMTREEGFRVVREIDSERPGALDYYLKITKLSEVEFYETMKQLKHLKLIDIDIPVRPKERPNRELTVPFFEQLISKHRDRPDPREQD